MNKPIKTTVVVVASALVGLGIGLASSSQAEPEVQTRTVTKVPAACIEALEVAENVISGPMYDAGNEHTALIDLIEQAMDTTYANVAAVNRITDGLNGYAERMGDITDQLNGLMESYNHAAAECRDEAGA